MDQGAKLKGKAEAMLVRAAVAKMNVFILCVVVLKSYEVNLVRKGWGSEGVSRNTELLIPLLVGIATRYQLSPAPREDKKLPYHGVNVAPIRSSRCWSEIFEIVFQKVFRWKGIWS